MSAKKKVKVSDINIQIRRIDNGYIVYSYCYQEGGEFKDSKPHKKELVYTSKEEAVKSAAALINAFSKDLI